MYGSKRRTEEIRALRKLGGQWLKKQRETVGLSQREFAKEVSLPYYTFISQVESGTARIPQEHYEIWARALKISVAAFAREMLKYYDPIIFDLLFSAGASQSPRDERRVA